MDRVQRSDLTAKYRRHPLPRACSHKTPHDLLGEQLKRLETSVGDEGAIEKIPNETSQTGGRVSCHEERRQEGGGGLAWVIDGRTTEHASALLLAPTANFPARLDQGSASDAFRRR
ncbi:hypothetical protein ZHAS_00018557 [Anopheles sinensis]|uniref:Uncharacterized protein n=1 Tax=Anopheles sinensis TaxID=74873 RepID=A0A084WJX3_ANOSI|nr:hypothetical protein ZHAS_00018557 [Anopheles sinensis]